MNNTGISIRSEVFLREDIAAILNALEMAAAGIPVPIDAVRRALHIETRQAAMPSVFLVPREMQPLDYRK